MSLCVEHSNGVRAMDRHQGLQLGSVPPNSCQGDPLQLIEQITRAKTAVYLGYLVSSLPLATDHESRLQLWPETQPCIRKPEKINQ